MARSTIYRLSDIRQAIIDVHDFTESIDQANFLSSPINDRRTFRAVSSALLEVGEAVKALPKELTDRYPEIPWRAVASMRDRLAHEYFRVDAAILWQTIEDGDLNILLDVIEEELKTATDQS